MTSAKEKSSRTKSAKSTKSTSASSARKSDSLEGSDPEPPSDSKNKKVVGRKGKAEKPPSKKEGTIGRKQAKPAASETNKKQGRC